MSLDEHWDPNMLIVCPFDEAHKIAASRFQRHIIKCRKNHPMKDTVTCPFNASHILLRPNLPAHLGKCPDRTAIEPDVIQAQCEETGEIQRIMGNVSIPRTWQSPKDSEDWDKEAEEYEHERFSQNSGNSHQEMRQSHGNRRMKPHARQNHFIGNRRGQAMRQPNSHIEKQNTDFQTNKHVGKVNNNSTTNGNSLYVRLAGRGHKLLENSHHTNNEPLSPDRQNQQMNFSTAGRGRGTVLLKSISN